MATPRITNSGRLLLLLYVFSYYRSVECGIRSSSGTWKKEPKTQDRDEAIELEPDVNPSFLDELLYPFWNKHCYLILRNYWHLDFVSKYVPLVSQYFVRKINWYTTLWVPEANPYRSKRLTGNIKCSDNYFMPEMKLVWDEWGYYYEIYHSRCVSIDNKRWTLAGRQGGCVMFLDYFMPINALADSNGHAIYPTSMQSPISWEPTIPRIHIMVPSAKFQPSHSEALLKLWLNAIAPWGEVHMCLFFAVNYGIDIKTNRSTLDVYALKPAYYIPVLIEHSAWKDLESQTLLDMEQTSNAGRHLWRLNFRTKMKVIDSLLITCNDLFAGFKFADRVAKTTIGLAHVITIIMGNFTFSLRDRERVCNSNFGDPVYVKSSPFILVSEMAEMPDDDPNFGRIPSFEFQNSLLHLRFVVCGNRDLGRPAYYEFVSVFELNVWVGLILTVFLTCTSIAPMRAAFTKKPHETTFFELYKVIIEQGDPFPSKLVESDRFRLVIVCFMLGCLVISNGYKNVNVYEMVQPRIPIKYENLDQLIADSYVLYSRMAENIVVIKRSQLMGDQQKNTQRFGFNLVDTYHTMRYEKEVSFVGEDGDLEDYFVEQKLLEFSQFHPRLEEMLNQSIDLYSKHRFKYKMIFKHYRELEDELMLKDLQTCNKTAVILPVLDVGRFKKKMQLKAPKIRLDVSVERYSRQPLKLICTSIISRALQKRIRLVKQANILSRWENLFVYDFEKEASFDLNKVVAAPLAGNVQMIFVVLLAGCGFTTLVFMAEIMTTLNFRATLQNIWVFCRTKRKCNI